MKLSSKIRIFFRDPWFFFGELHSCPRRVEIGSIEGAASDRWNRGRWSAYQKLRDAWLRFTRRLIGGTVWNWSWHPRTCSYCGGVNPDDAIKLVSEGWKCERTTKIYKLYLEPPAECNWKPVPPVKVYTQHFTIDQWELLLDKWPVKKKA